VYLFLQVLNCLPQRFKITASGAIWKGNVYRSYIASEGRKKKNKTKQKKRKTKTKKARKNKNKQAKTKNSTVPSFIRSIIWIRNKRAS